MQATTTATTAAEKKTNNNKKIIDNKQQSEFRDKQTGGAASRNHKATLRILAIRLILPRRSGQIMLAHYSIKAAGPPTNQATRHWYSHQTRWLFVALLHCCMNASAHHFPIEIAICLNYLPRISKIECGSQCVDVAACYYLQPFSALSLSLVVTVLADDDVSVAVNDTRLMMTSCELDKQQ